MTRKWAREFPDYDGTTLPAIPKKWTDESWRNDTCPSWDALDDGGDRLRVFCDYPLPEDREFSASPRYCAYIQRGDGGAHVDLAASDDWQDILAAVVGWTFADILREELSFVEWEDMRRRNVKNKGTGICASHDFADANMSMAAAFEALGLPIWTNDGDAMRDDALALWNAAWAFAFARFLCADGGGMAAAGTCPAEAEVEEPDGYNCRACGTFIPAGPGDCPHCGLS